MSIAQYCVVRIKAGHLARKILADPGPQKFSAPSVQASYMPSDFFKNPKNPAGALSPTPHPSPMLDPFHPQEVFARSSAAQGGNDLVSLGRCRERLQARQAHHVRARDGRLAISLRKVVQQLARYGGSHVLAASRAPPTP